MKKRRFYLHIIIIGLLSVQYVASQEVAFDESIFTECKFTNEAMQFTAENLWDYINGGAVVYNAYDFQKLWVYRLSHSSGEEFVVEVYDMQNNCNAYGIYATERIKSAPSAGIGVNSFVKGENLFFWQDRYYIKIIAYQPIEGILKNTAIIVSANLPNDASMPKEFEKLPKTFKVEGSEMYSRKEIFGQEYLINGFKCDYQTKEEAPFNIYLLVYDSAEESNRAHQQFFDYQLSTGNIKKKDLKIGSQSFQINDAYYGPVNIILKEEYLIAITGTKDKSLITKLFGEFSF